MLTGPMTVGGVLFSLEGRISRSQFWLKGFLPLLATTFVLERLGGMLHLGVLGWVAWLLSLYCGFAIALKRLHDREHSGWFFLVSLIPVIGQAWLLIELGLLSGTRGPNRYGLDQTML